MQQPMVRDFAAYAEVPSNDAAQERKEFQYDDRLSVRAVYGRLRHGKAARIIEKSRLLFYDARRRVFLLQLISMCLSYFMMIYSTRQSWSPDRGT